MPRIRIQTATVAAALRAATTKYAAIYADPPYNASSTRAYQDRFSVAEYNALIARSFEHVDHALLPGGSLWISCDDRSVHRIRLWFEDYSSLQYVATIVWQKRATRENRGPIGDSHEYLLVYTNDVRAFTARRNRLEHSPDGLRLYKDTGDPKGPWRENTLTAPGGHSRPNQHYAITAPTGKVHWPPKGRCWSVIPATYERLVREGRISFGPKGDAQPKLIVYLSESKGLVPWTWWPHTEVGTSAEGKREQYALFGRGNGIDTPKPQRLLHRVWRIAARPGDRVLELFSGSGTGVTAAYLYGCDCDAVEMDSQAVTRWIQPRLARVGVIPELLSESDAL